jgi:methionyl-tRNA formyltransferase
VRLLFAGTPATAVPALEAVLGSTHELLAVITRPDAPAGRGRTLRPSPVAERAEQAGIEVWKPKSLRDPEFLAQLADAAPDCVPVVAYGGLVPEAALSVPRHGWVNLHFSLLPAWRGAAPVQHSILHGDEVTGATTFRLEAGLDTGPVYGLLTEEIKPTDTSGELLDRLALSGARLLVATLDGIEDGSLVAVPQSHEGVSLAPKLMPTDARVDWKAPAVRVDRLVRACSPAPGAWTTFRERRLKLGPVEVLGSADLAPGVLQTRPHGVAAGTATADVLLRQVQPEGKPMMAADAWARGVRLAEGDQLG